MLDYDNYDFKLKFVLWYPDELIAHDNKYDKPVREEYMDALKTDYWHACMRSQ